ncbi:WD40 repeat domain-containing protein [Streptomyces sp. NPDC060020]|uniref:WD40 repeat domain-containing protein n=1 Tax=Streptomyces sp. NPDC060020 TaxID=3347038 RepID=UPI0036973FD8
MGSDGNFEEELSRLAGDLRQLRIERGNPSYRKLEARAAKSRTALRLPVATQSDAFRGKRLLGLDTLMALVRILYAYDEYGREAAVPPHNSPRLEPWRTRWRTLAALQPPAPDRIRDLPPPGNLQALRRPAPTPPAPTGSHGFALAHRLTTRAHDNWGAVFSPDGRLVAAASRGGVVQLWEPVRGRAVGVLDAGPENVLAMAFSPDSRTLATVGVDRTPRLWDPVTLTQVGPPMVGHEETVRAVAFSADGRVLITASDDETVRRWDTATGEPAGTPLIGHFGEVGSVACLPDGGLMAALKGKHVIRLWDLVAGASVGEPLTGHVGEVLGMAFSQDGRLLATAGDDGTRLWNTTTGAAVGGPLQGPDPATWGAAFSRDGWLLATACDDGTVRLWDPATGGSVGEPLVGNDWSLHEVAFSFDGRMLAACGEGDTVVIYHRDPAEAGPVPSLGARSVAAALRRGHPVPLPAVSSTNGTPLRRLAFAPDGDRLLVHSADRRVLTWDPETGDPLPETLSLLADGPWGLEFPEEGGPARLWSRDTAGPEPLRSPLSLVQHVAFTPDGRRVVMTGGRGNWAISRTAAGGSEAIADPAPERLAVSVSPDGRSLAVAEGQTVNVFDLATLVPVERDLGSHAAEVRAMAFSPDGSVLATGDIGGGVRLWDLTARPPHSRQVLAHTGAVHDLAFSPDGRLLAGAASDGTAQLWDAHTAESAVGLPLTGHSGAVRGVAFSPDGSLLATAGDDGTVRRWVLPDPYAPTARAR